MEINLERLGSAPSHKEWRPLNFQGDPNKQLLYKGAEEMPKEPMRSRFALKE